MHRPRSLDEAAAARRRLALEELLVLQVGLARRRREREDDVARALPPPGELVRALREALPFRLTAGQEQAISELDADLERAVPMERLLQGDVGSGKTVVALYALLRAVEAGFRGALMAPTETLAEQHFLTLESFCTQLGVTCGLLTSSAGKRDREQAAGAAVVVGTHALIQAGVDLGQLAVAVVDEQHRFGVEQRKALSAGTRPHTLHMTATPIPRTLALTVYGDLSVSEITELPAGRRPIVTSWVTAERSSEAYRRLRRHLEAGRQAYVVCPLVSESVAIEARAAEQEAERLQRAELRGLRVGCMHGQLRPAERRDLMARFKAGQLDVLVATTVIEVGVDVPNATIMIVQEADRFGLAQLHQLRGRVGRGAEQSYCLLVSRPKEELTETAIARLEALVETADGFQLAEVDLELRGAGELLGVRQSGLTDFRYARLVADRPLLELARAEADALADYEGPLNDEIDAPLRRRLTARVRIVGGSQEGCEDLRSERSGHETDLGSRPRGDLRDPRLGGGRERARPLRGLGRARAWRRCPAAPRARHSSNRTLPPSRRSSEISRSSGSRAGSSAPTPRATSRGRTSATTSSSSTRPTSWLNPSACRSQNTFRACSPRAAASSTRRRPAWSPNCRSPCARPGATARRS